MIGELMGSLDFSLCAEISLVLFVSVFISIGVRLLFMGKGESARYAQIPINDDDVRRHPNG